MLVDMNRCKWCNLKNAKYIKYHDEEWGVLNLDDRYLFEMLILESFQAGLSWECVLNKREDFRKAYDNFDINKDYGYISIYTHNGRNVFVTNKVDELNLLKSKYASLDTDVVIDGE